jgi:hypothetical protein
MTRENDTVLPDADGVLSSQLTTDTGQEMTVIGFGTDYRGTLKTLSAAMGANRRVIGWDQWPLPPVESPREGRSMLRRLLNRLRQSR